MMLWPAVAIAVGGALFSLALAALFAENLRVPELRVEAPVTLVLAATGPLPGLDRLFAALAAQTLAAKRLIVTVEAREDPAHRRVAERAAHYPQLNIELVVAGVSARRGQKCTNLLAALSRLSPEDGHVVLFDADIRPQPWWLAALVAPLANGRADIVNGYRWPVADRPSLAALIVAAIDRRVAVLPRLGWARAIWGGSLALTPRALAALALPATIGGTLTEDLPIGERAARAGLRVLVRRILRVPTPLPASFAENWRFGRRQYQLMRVYRPRVWAFAAAMVSADLLARLVLVAALIGSGSGLAAAALVAAALLGSIAVELRCAIGRTLGIPDPTGFRLAQHGLAWTILPVPAFHASVIWAGAIASSVAWAHVRYRLDGAGRVLSSTRRPP